MRGPGRERLCNGIEGSTGRDWMVGRHVTQTRSYERSNIEFNMYSSYASRTHPAIRPPIAQTIRPEFQNAWNFQLDPEYLGPVGENRRYWSSPDFAVVSPLFLLVWQVEVELALKGFTYTARQHILPIRLKIRLLPHYESLKSNR
jgi:hypothetical protein